MTAKKHSPGGECCTCPSIDLHTVADWVGVAGGSISGTSISYSEDFEAAAINTYATALGWTKHSGTVDPTAWRVQAGQVLMNSAPQTNAIERTFTDAGTFSYDWGTDTSDESVEIYVNDVLQNTHNPIGGGTGSDSVAVPAAGTVRIAGTTSEDDCWVDNLLYTVPSTDTDGEYTTGGVRTWLSITGIVEPASTIGAPDNEAYNIEFRMRGSLTVSIDAVDFVINATAGTLTAGATSTDIPADADYSNPDTAVQIRTTPTHTHISTSGSVDYGTTHVDRGLGAVLTVDRVANPTGDFTLTGTGEFYDLTIKSTRVVYSTPCDGYGVSDLELACPWTPLVPINYRAFESALKSDGATFMDWRWDPSGGVSGDYLWPDITYLLALPGDGTFTYVDAPGCREIITNYQDFFCDASYGNWRRPTVAGISGPTSGETSCIGGTGNFYEYSGATVPDDVDGAFVAGAASTGFADLSGRLWDGALLFRRGGAPPNRLQKIILESEIPPGSLNWVETENWDKLWPFNGTYVGPTGPYFTELLIAYEFDAVGSCADPYPLPTFEAGVYDFSLTGALDSFETSVTVNSIASGFSFSSSYWQYQF